MKGLVKSTLNLSPITIGQNHIKVLSSPLYQLTSKSVVLPPLKAGSKTSLYSTPPLINEGPYLINEFLNRYFPGEGSIFVGPADAFLEYNEQNFHLLFREFISRPKFWDNPNIRNWESILTYRGTQQTKSIVTNITFCHERVSRCSKCKRQSWRE